MAQLWYILYRYDEPVTETRTLKRTRAETNALNWFLRFLRLQVDVQFEVFDIGVEALCCLCNLLIGVPFQKGSIGCKKKSGLDEGCWGRHCAQGTAGKLDTERKS